MQFKINFLQLHKLGFNVFDCVYADIYVYKVLMDHAMYSRSKKKRNTPIYFNTNYHIEMTLVPIIMD